MEKIKIDLILKLIGENCSCNQICKKLNIDNRELYDILLKMKLRGINLERKYYSNGDISYRPITSSRITKQLINRKDNTIITRPSEQDLRVLVISDLHFGSKFDRLDLLNEAYDYCQNNGIHIIFNCGDLIDGTFGYMPKKIDNIHEQIEYLIEEYPFDSNILNFCVGGDHDLSVLNKFGQNIKDALKNYRQDIIMGDFVNSYINIKNDRIVLIHKTDTTIYYGTNRHSVAFYGHSHDKMRYFLSDLEKSSIYVPALCNLGRSLPGMLDVTLNFDKGYIKNIHVKEIEIDGKKRIITDHDYDCTIKNSTNDIIENEEEYSFYQPNPNSFVKKLVPKSSMIDRFNKRYGLDNK